MQASEKISVPEPARSGGCQRPRPSTAPLLTELVYELLDAHDDTARLAGKLAPDMRWQAHLAYLRDLQRTGRAALARLEPAPGGAA